jgi:hypothetical protein
MNAELRSLIRLRDAALRDLDRADRIDKGSRWLTHPDEMRSLSARFHELDARVEAMGESP